MDWLSVRKQAKANMTEAGWGYDEGAADLGGQADYDTLAWRHYAILPRTYQNTRTISTSVEVGGMKLATPLIGMPTAYHRLTGTGAETDSQNGAHAAGSFIVYPTNASQSVEEFAAGAQGDWWTQVYLFTDREKTYGFLERAVEQGAKALMLTLDCPGFKADFGFRNGIDGTPEGGSGNFPSMKMGDWTHNLASDITVEDITVLKERFGVPVWVKGVLRPEDAEASIQAGAAGIVVSNHGRRQVDGVVPVAWALPRVAAAVAGRVPIIADSGIRTAGDVFRAIALGADAVGLGRGMLWAHAAGGAEGVQKAFEQLTFELAHLMGSAGVSRIADIDASMLIAEQGPAAIARLQQQF